VPIRYAVLLGVSAGLVMIAALAPTTQEARAPAGVAHDEQTRRVDLGALVRDFVADIPRRGSEGMDVPSAAESAAFTEALAAAQSARLAQARDLLAPLSYTVVPVRDTATHDRLLVVRERQRADGSWPHGWGLYVLRTHPSSRLDVQVPHPLFDVNTPELGVSAFRRARAESLFVAGTHRYANADGTSDVAHSAQSIFQQATRAVVGPGALVLQFHGFGEDSFPHYGEVVVSDGQEPPSAQSLAVTDALRAAGFTACLYDGTGCAGLAATTNVQGRWTRTTGAGFLHIELVRHLRDDPRRRHLLARLVADTLAD
jgi:hypothetical protein